MDAIRDTLMNDPSWWLMPCSRCQKDFDERKMHSLEGGEGEHSYIFCDDCWREEGLDMWEITDKFENMKNDNKAKE